MTTVRQTGARGAARELEAIADRLESSAVWGGALLDEVLDVQAEWWNTLGRGSWAPDKPTTLAEDRRTGDDTRLMRDRGALEAASTQRGAQGQEIEIGDDHLVFAVTLPYAEPLARAGRSAVLDPTDRDAERFAEIFVHELLDG